jgi:thiol:disulfide interchange protein
MRLNTVLKNKEDLKQLLAENNPGVIIVKFSADWCKPCQVIKPFVESRIARLPVDKIHVVNVDIDNSMDLYGFLKTKRLIQGIPTLFAYYAENKSAIPDDMVSGSKESDIVDFFTRCTDEVA